MCVAEPLEEGHVEAAGPSLGLADDRRQLKMVSDENKLVCVPERAYARRECDLTRFIDDAVVEPAAVEQGAGVSSRDGTALTD